MRVLVITNMYPTPERPALGSFVRDQVSALRRHPGLELELFAFPAGSPAAYARAVREARRRFAAQRYDVVHAHFGLTAWPALAVRAGVHAVTLHGTDLAHPRSRLLTTAALPWLDLVATVSAPLAEQVPGWAVRGARAVLPCGVDLSRFTPSPRAQARARLGLDPEQPCLLFPADPGRREKRHDRAAAVAGATPLHTLGNVDPAQVPDWINAANAVLVPSEREGFGLAALEALACDVPVLATPVGIHPEALAGVAGTLCAPFEAGVWREALAPHLAAPDPRVPGRAAAQRYSSDAMASRVLAAWTALMGSATPV